MLEHHLRQRTKNYSDNIQFEFGKTVRQLTYDATENRITGVIVESSDKTSTEYRADFTVDAPGRGGGGLRWLTALGLPVPNVDEVKVNFGYSSCKIKLRDQSQRDWNGVACGGLPPKDGRGGLMLPIEDGLHICSIGGRFRDYPPTEESEFRAYVKNLAVDVMHEAIDDAEIVSPIVKMRYKANRFRHYESLESLPSGFIPLGDAYCSVNPTYGQGMSSTSLQAKALESALASLNDRQGIADIPAAYFPKAKEIVTQIWRNANFSDFAFPETEGDRSDYGEEERDYNMALQIVSFTDEALRLKLVKVGQYMEKPEILETPEIRQKVAAQLSRAEGEIADLESSRVDVPIEVLNTYVGLYEFDSALLKTLQVKLQGNDLEIVGIDANGTALFTDKLVTLGPNKFAVDNKMVSVRFIIENNEVVGMESNQNQRISVSRRTK